jgi:SAM-dependent methyltransferase
VRALPPDQSIGIRDYDLIGRILLGALLMAGLKPGDALVDFGCGTGRLAVHAIPWLQGGRYIGIDISKTMLAHARVLVDQKVPSPPCSVVLVHQTTPDFSLPDKSVDMVCAFSGAAFREYKVGSCPQRMTVIASPAHSPARSITYPGTIPQAVDPDEILKP